MEFLGIVLGLGNPGATYQQTRHNLGFRVVDRLAQLGGSAMAVDAGIGPLVWTAEVTIEGGPCILAKPRTFMNRSGRAGALLSRFCEIPPQRMVVVYDDADLELGRIRVRSDGGPGGHNGVRSLIDSLATSAFPRVRLGVRGTGRTGVDLADYVLEEFEPREQDTADALVELGAQAATSVLVEGVTATMNVFNNQSAAKPSEIEKKTDVGTPDKEET